MANFKTHKNIGILSSVVAVPVMFYINEIIHIFTFNFETISLMIILNIIGSLFPDIDLKTSKPTKILNATLIFLLSILYLLNIHFLINKFPDIDSKLLYAGVIIIPFILSQIILMIVHSITYHRGVIHSIPFALILSIIIFKSLEALKGLNMPQVNFDSLIVAIGFLWGFLTHLILDEVYSVDFRNRRIKSSAWTAFTFYSNKNPIAYLGLYIILFFLIKESNLLNIFGF